MRNPFHYNLLLAVGWCALMGRLTVADLVVGFVLGGIALSISSPMFGRMRYYDRVFNLTRLLLYFMRVFLASCARVAWDVLTPVHKARPAIVAIPLSVTDPIQIVTLANLISLTPGSLSLDVSPDHKTLYVHCMFVDDPDEVRRDVKSGLEWRVMEALQ